MDIDEFEDYLETVAEQEDPDFQKQIIEGYEVYKQGKTRTVNKFLSTLSNKDK